MTLKKFLRHDRRPEIVRPNNVIFRLENGKKAYVAWKWMDLQGMFIGHFLLRIVQNIRLVMSQIDVINSFLFF